MNASMGWKKVTRQLVWLANLIRHPNLQRLHGTIYFAGQAKPASFIDLDWTPATQATLSLCFSLLGRKSLFCLLCQTALLYVQAIRVLPGSTLCPGKIGFIFFYVTVGPKIAPPSQPCTAEVSFCRNGRIPAWGHGLNHGSRSGLAIAAHEHILLGRRLFCDGIGSQQPMMRIKKVFGNPSLKKYLTRESITQGTIKKFITKQIQKNQLDDISYILIEIGNKCRKE